MGRQINLNCDMGESYGRWTLGDDGPLMALSPPSISPAASTPATPT